MSLFDRLEQRSIMARDPVLIEFFGGGSRSGAGVSVTPQRAMGLMAVWAAVRLISETLAGLPFGIYRRLEKGREAFTSHPIHEKLHDRPNEWQTSFEWREMMQAHVLLRGNAYSRIIETKGGYVDQLIPLHPDRMTPRYESLVPGGPKVRYYSYVPVDGPAKVYLPEEIFHLKGLSDDGIVGLSPLEVAREALGLAIAAEDHGARFIANNVQPGGVFEHAGRLSPQAYERLKADLEKKRAGAQNAGKALILEEGLKWTQLGMTNKDAQFLESRKFSVTEIARMFKVPPHMIADLERATFTNIEHQGIDFVTHTMMPWINRWEQRVNHSLLGPTERKTIFARFTVQSLLRGDTAARGAFYKQMWDMGAFSPNDILEHEDMNPVPGGDKRFVPLNVTTLEKAGEEELTPEPDPEPTSAPKQPAPTEENERTRVLRQRIEVAHTRLFLDAATRIMAKEIKAAERAVAKAREQKSVAPIDRWLESYDKDHETLVQRALLPVLHATGDALTALLRVAPLDYEAMATQAALRHVSKQRATARDVLVGGYAERATALETLVKGWESRAQEMAGDEVTRLSDAITHSPPALDAAA